MQNEKEIRIAITEMKNKIMNSYMFINWITYMTNFFKKTEMLEITK